MLLFLSIFLISANSELYALLWAGIFPYGDLGYTAEATMYQAYHQFIQNGVKPENIITFGMDVAANNPKNPFPGEVFAYPGGPDVYEGFKFDYIFRNNTPENIFKVLNNEETGCGSGRTFKTTEEDDIMIVSFNHGGPNCVAFIYDENWTDLKYMLASDLRDNFLKMKKNGLYRNIVFYMTACQSGSMFFPLMNETENIYALTAAPPQTDAIACDCQAERKNKSLPCLNSCFAKYWQKYSRDASASGKMFQETIEDQYRDTVDHINNTKGEWFQEYFCEYGDKSLKDKFIGLYQTGKKSTTFTKTNEKNQRRREVVIKEELFPNNVKEVLYRNHPKKKKAWDNLFVKFEKNEIVNENPGYDPKNCYLEAHVPELSHFLNIHKKRNCFERVSSLFDERCGRLKFYDIKNLQLVWRLCEENREKEISVMIKKNC